jgi:protein pelota
MKIIHKDLKKGEIKLQVETLTDLWYLSHIIDPGDYISGKTLRKLKIGDGDNQKVVRKPVFMEIEAEKTDFSRTSNLLRITGKIRKGPDDVPLGTYHSFNIDLNTIFMIIKQQWLSYQLDKITEATKETKSSILLVVLDRDEAHVAALERYGYTYLSSLHGSVQKKDYDQGQGGNFYKDIEKLLLEYNERYTLTAIILGSPSFWKEDLLKAITNEDLKKIIIPATCSAVGKKAFDELLRRDEVQKALKDQRISEEIIAVEKLLTEIAQDGLAVYGFNETKNAGDAGAVETLLVTDTFIWKRREEGTFKEVDQLFKNIETSRGKIKIVSHEHEAGNRLDGLGGIGGLLRYKMSY